MIEYRICSKCDKEKEENEVNFRLCRYVSGIVYFKSFCKICEKQSNKDFARKHSEERKQYQRNYTIQNPEYKKNYRIINKNKINEKERLRRQNNINFKLKKNVSRAISHAIFKNGNSTIKYLSYTIDELKKHLENQFDDKMTWDNYGSYWHIDHIIPHSMFKYFSMEDEAFKECWALTNLRPLEAEQNKLDGSTRARHTK